LGRFATVILNNGEESSSERSM